MRKLAKRLCIALICIAAVAVVVHMAPEIADLAFGSARVEWVSERFSEALSEKKELVVYEVQITAQETVSQDAWLIGTVQKVEIPYTFAVRYVLDLSQAEITALEDGVSIKLPSPQAKYQQLTVDEENVRKKDWLYPLTPERYAEIKAQLEEKLLIEYSTTQAYLDEAWKTAVLQIENLFESLTNNTFLIKDCALQISPKDAR